MTEQEITDIVAQVLAALANLPISALPNVVTVLGTDALASVQEGITKQMSMTQVKDFVELDDVGAAFGEMFFQANATETVIAVQGTPVLINGTYVSGELSEFSHIAGKLTYTGSATRVFQVQVNTTASLDLTAANVTVLIAKNSIIVATSGQSPDLDGVSPSFKSIGASKLVELSTNDTIEVFTQNNDDTSNITHQDISVQVGSPGFTGATSGSAFSVFAQTNTVGFSNTTIETTLTGTGAGNLVFPANSLNVGDSFSVVLSGHYSTQSALPGDKIHFRLKSGTVLFFDSGSLTVNAALTSRAYSVKVTSTVQAIGAAGVARIHSLMDFGGMTASPSTPQSVFVDTTNFDTTIPLTLDLTGQWNIAQINNSINSKLLTISRI